MTKNIINSELLKCNILQKEYKILSGIICNLENMITINENILLFSKNQSMKLLNELIKKLNETYNNSIISILSNEMNINSVQNESMYSDIPDLKSENKSDYSEFDKDDSSNENSLSSDENTIKLNSDEEYLKEKKIKSEEKKKSSKSIFLEENFKLSKEDIFNLEMIEQIKNLSLLENNKNYFNKYQDLLELSKYNPFESIKKQIIILGKIVGFTSIKDIIYLSLNINNYNFEQNDKQMYELLENVFIPLDFQIDKTNYLSEIKIIKTTSTYLVLFNNQCDIIICVGYNLFKINGYIKNDPLNIYIRTSQISNNILYNKKTNFEKIINGFDKYNINPDTVSNTNIVTNLNLLERLGITKDNLNKLNKVNKEFADVYLKNLTITEILILSNNDFIDKLYTDYVQFSELNKMQFVKLIKNFTKDASENLSNMFNTIRLLLLGTDENCAVASLLFNLLKDKKVSNGSEFIANVIYHQLNYIGQLKLKKSTFNIKNELDKLKGITNSDIDLKKQVLLSKNMPEHIKKICLEKLEELKNANNETYKIKMYVNILIQFPWLSESDDNVFKIVSSDKSRSKKFLENVESKLNEQIYGHNLAKSKILQILAKLISVQGTHISPIALAGPPGVGKTKFAQCLAECLDIPFVQITLGGQNDGELLHGHGYTYSGAQPGLIVKKMVDAGSARCIMYFDELDKCVSKNGQVNELMSILIHLTDPMTNGSFQDRFFQEITFPLNKVIFIFSFNDINKIDKILLDRMEVIDVESYSIKEKITISNDYLLKQLCKDIGFDYGAVKFEQDILSYIIEQYTFEPGVRSLKRCIENTLLKLNIDKIYQRGVFENEIEYTQSNPLIITKELIQEYLGDIKVNYKTIHSKDIVGVVNGLYATSMCSGGIVPIQLTGYHVGKAHKFVLKLTGNQKKIMKESIVYSFTTAINLLTNEGKELFFKKYPNGIHIHTPEAATPKDGPSAGVAFTLAFLSVMLDLKINREIALTGEIDLYGNVTKIGGVKYKVQGAFKAGVKTVFLPQENKEDLDKVKKELPEIFDDLHQCFFIEHVLDVAEKALIDWDEKKYLIQSNKH
jgi:endopeptidase La